MNAIRDRLLWIIIGLEVAVLVVILTLAIVHPHKAAAPAPAAVQTTTPQQQFNAPVIEPVLFAKGLASATSIVATGTPGDKSLFVTERQGFIRTLDNKGVVSGPVLDITPKVLDNGEMGLLGLAFHPKFKDNHYFYAYYINRDKKTVVARYTMDPATNTAKASTEKVLLTLQQVYGNHKGGQLQFGPDGYLYIGIGDGGSAGDPDNHGQDTHTWFGKILRIDVDHGDPYSVPSTNPFARSTDTSVKPEIWAMGLRNPWRFSFDSKTKDLYIADVGQDKYEEVDVQKASSKGGENYGWRCYEATHSYNAAGCKGADQYVMPMLEYAHDNKRCSITGGYVYRGSAEPALVGKYLYGDYCTGEIFYASVQNGAWTQTLGIDTDNAISTFGQDNSGELYYADVANGNIYHLTDSAN
ncbi:MAG TPA: PQQ-dependent sugar dehydrogenase [Patescibacteria group bacterium]|nr:PQQ-dependent sugar dehydrogenase [Patescibacteria group bacterium]